VPEVPLRLTFQTRRSLPSPISAPARLSPMFTTPAKNLQDPGSLYDRLLLGRATTMAEFVREPVGTPLGWVATGAPFEWFGGGVSRVNHRQCQMRHHPKPVSMNRRCNGPYADWRRGICVQDRSLSATRIPQKKGIVESGVKYIKTRLFLPLRRIPRSGRCQPAIACVDHDRGLANRVPRHHPARYR